MPRKRKTVGGNESWSCHPGSQYGSVLAKRKQGYSTATVSPESIMCPATDTCTPAVYSQRQGNGPSGNVHRQMNKDNAIHVRSRILFSC